jgi:hypothetical protein
MFLIEYPEPVLLVDLLAVPVEQLVEQYLVSHLVELVELLVV